MAAAKNSKSRHTSETSTVSEPSGVVPFIEDEESSPEPSDFVDERTLEPGNVESTSLETEKTDGDDDARHTSETSTVSEPSGVVHTHVRVRARLSKLRGFILRGRPLTVDGFTLALAELPAGELEQFRSEPLAIVELFTPEG